VSLCIRMFPPGTRQPRERRGSILARTLSIGQGCFEHRQDHQTIITSSLQIGSLPHDSVDSGCCSRTRTSVSAAQCDDIPPKLSEVQVIHLPHKVTVRSHNLNVLVGIYTRALCLTYFLCSHTPDGADTIGQCLQRTCFPAHRGPG
jgi:hypothetical protein